MAGLTPDPWQTSFLRSPSRRALLLCCRGAGKSTAAAALALTDAILSPGALVLILSPSERQSGEMALKVRNYYHAAGQPVGALKETELELRLQNGSRIVALPGTERTVRSYQGVHRLIIDEAARVPDDLYKSVRPMVGVSGGSILALSTPFGRRGWFYEAWESARKWQRITVRARECPRLTEEFLEEERAELGSTWYAQEYECSFELMAGALFQRQWFGIVDAAPADLTLVRRWDFAASKPKPGRLDPDFTSGVKLGRSFAGRYYVCDLRRTRDTAGGVEALVRQTAEMDGRAVPIRIEQEPGSAGLFVVDQFVRVVLPGWDVRGLPSTGDKAARARPLAAQAEAGNVSLIRAPWNKELLDELEVFPLGSHDDQVDALSGAFQDLTQTAPPGARVSTGRAQTRFDPDPLKRMPEHLRGR